MVTEQTSGNKIINIEEFRLNRFLNKKGILDKRDNTNNSTIKKCVSKLTQEKIVNNDELVLKFNTKEQVYKFLYRMCLSELLQMKIYNKHSKLVNDFFDTLTSR